MFLIEVLRRSHLSEWLFWNEGQITDEDQTLQVRRSYNVSVFLLNNLNFKGLMVERLTCRSVKGETVLEWNPKRNLKELKEVIQIEKGNSEQNILEASEIVF